MNTPADERRMGRLSACFCCIFAALAARLAYIQGVQPDTPRYMLGGAPPRVVYRPATRGEIVDARGARLAHSVFAYNLRVDPVAVGTNAAALANHLAPHLAIPARKLEQAFTIRPEPHWKPAAFTSVSGVVVTNQVLVWHTNRSVLFAANLTEARLESFRSHLLLFRTQEEAALEAAENGIRRRRTNAPALPPWDLPGRFLRGRAFAAEARAVSRRLRPIRRANNEVRRGAVVPEIIERRLYPHETLAGPVLGSTTNGPVPLVAYNGFRLQARELPPEIRGAEGIERQFDDELRGVPGKLVARGHGRREIVNTREEDIAARPGVTVRLALDANLQYIVEDALRSGMDRLRANWMSAVMVEVATGEILAIGNITDPDWRPGGLSATNAPPRGPVRRNHAVSELVEPGSTFKLVTYAAAIDSGRITPETRIDCGGGVWQPPAGRRKPVQDARGHKLGIATAEEAFAASSNVGAAKIGFGELWSSNAPPGPTVLVNYASAFGFMSRTGILCGGEPDTRLRVWEGRGTQIILSYGYGMYATPLQIAMAYAAIANNGRLMEPMLVKAVESPDGRVIRAYAPRTVRTTVAPETARQMLRLLTAVVGPGGTGKDAALEDYVVAGKTGTANKMTREHLASGAAAHFSTFVGFFPAEKPRVCLLVCADEPKSADGRAAYGAACIPTFREIAKETASYLTIPPSPRAMAATATARRHE